MPLSDKQIAKAIQSVDALWTQRLRERRDPFYIDTEMAFPGLVMADVKQALEELQEIRRQNAWVRQQLDPTWRPA